MSSSFGADYSWGRGVPPVAPEVINIVLLQRRSCTQDDPPDHVYAMEVFGGSKT